MTTEEKKQKIHELCMSHSPCCTDNGRCPLYDRVGIICEPEAPEEVEFVYNLAFGEPNDKSDMVNKPPHYTQGNIECIDAMVAAFGKEAVAYFCICNAFKYVWRSEHKNGKEDIDKTIWYLNKYVELKSDERTEAV